MALPAWVVPAAIAAGQSFMNMAGHWRQRKLNENYVRESNAYNSPRSQMLRYQSAGLNPRLIYGQGNPGNQSQPLSAPEGMGRLGSDAVSAYNQSTLAQSQVAVQAARTDQTRALTEVNKLQAEVLRNNPLLHGALTPIIETLKQAVREKTANATSAEVNAWMEQTKKDYYSTRAYVDGVGESNLMGEKLSREMQLLNSRFNLDQHDMELKRQVLESKEFQNAILEVEKRFMTEGDITPKNVLEFIKVLLMKIK